VLKHPKVEPFVNDDAGKVESYPILDQIYYLAAYETQIAGMFMVHPINYVTCDAHSAILPRYYGKKAIEAGKLAIKWVFENTHFLKINGSTPKYNKLALKYSFNIGFRPEGVNKASFLKDGILYDQIYFGLERAKWLQAQQ
jgi:RimJ/RimL family protein N-acetyltransferase